MHDNTYIQTVVEDSLEAENVTIKGLNRATIRRVVDIALCYDKLRVRSL